MELLKEQEQTKEYSFPSNVGQEVERTRALQEVQGAMLMARQLPRDEQLAYKKIMDAAKRQTLAEQATYCYPRGGEQVKGPSVRAAETLALYWGNISYGIKELSQNTADHSSEVLAYAWDYENNVRTERVFKVSHVRYSKKNGLQILTDPRDIYEKVANDGARRKRAVLLEVLPRDIVEDFLAECEKTLLGANTKPLKQRITEMLKLFEELGVTQEMIEKRIGTKCDSFIVKNIVDLGGVYNSIKNNFAPISQYFDIPTLAEVQKIKVEKEILNKSSKSKKDKEPETIQEYGEYEEIDYEQYYKDVEANK